MVPRTRAAQRIRCNPVADTTQSGMGCRRDGVELFVQVFVQPRRRRSEHRQPHMPKPMPSLAAVLDFLRTRHPDAHDLTALHGGEWSSAFAFRASHSERLVIRFGHHPDDYGKDRLAAGWSRPGLPVPEFLAMGEALDVHYAITRHVDGTRLNELPTERMRRAIPNLFAAMAQLREITPPGAGFGLWTAPEANAPHAHWRDVLCAVAHRDDARLAGWRDALRAHADVQRIFDAAQQAVERLAPHCPDERRLVHDDLLYGNVLVDEYDRIAAVLDWGTSMVGDPLHEVAPLLFWQPWYPGIDTTQVEALARAAFPVPGYEERVAACQLHTALSGMQYQAFAGFLTDLNTTAAHTARLLARLP
jgi:aminoglycoside phosphotransferase (APT) family kinase protein